MRHRRPRQFEAAAARAPAPAGRASPGISGAVTVAMLISRKPSRPITSIAVTTDWCVARPSARTVTGAARSAVATLRIAARSVSGDWH